MKIRWIALALAAMMLTACLCSCRGVKIEHNQDNDTYIDKKGNEYLRAPYCYEPVSYKSDKSYGRMVAGIGEYELFQIVGAEEGKWLTTKDRDVVYLKGETLPTLENFSTDRIMICREAERIHAFATMKDQTEIADVLLAYLDGESVPYPSGTPLENLRLRFASDEYPYLYYCLAYLEYSDDVIVYTTDADGNEIETNLGKYFLFNRAENRCVPIGEVVHRYVEE